MEATVTLDSLVKSAIEDAITSDAIAAKVKAAAEKAVSDSIESAFGYNSDFRKGITKAIGEVIPIAKVDDLAIFANAVRAVLQARLANLASDTAKVHVDAVLEKLLPASPIITMDELKKAYIAKVASEASISDCSCHEDGDSDPEITWAIARSEGILDDYWDLWMAPEEDASRWDKDAISLRFRGEEDGLHECWNVSAGGKDNLFGSIFAGPLWGFDAMIFRLATGTAKLKK